MANYSLQAKSSLPSVFYTVYKPRLVFTFLNGFLKSFVHIIIYIVYGYFCTTMIELSSGRLTNLNGLKSLKYVLSCLLEKKLADP